MNKPKKIKNFWNHFQEQPLYGKTHFKIFEFDIDLFTEMLNTERERTANDVQLQFTPELHCT